MAPLNQPAILQCLALVVGLYGVLYYGVLYYGVARRPARGWLIATVGLTGNVLSSAGPAVQIVRGTWPPSSVVLCVTNDLIWWVPFGFSLRDALPSFIADVRSTRSD